MAGVLVWRSRRSCKQNFGGYKNQFDQLIGQTASRLTDWACRSIASG